MPGKTRHNTESGELVAIGEPQTPEEWVTFLHDQYVKTENPVHLLGAFCWLPADADGNKTVPQWMALALDNGFNTYLTGLTAGRSLSLEAALGIDDKTRIQCTSIEKMAGFVHLYRQLFNLKSNIAVRAVYMKYRNYIKASGQNLKHQGVTRGEDEFKQYYDRLAKKGYPDWLSKTEGIGEYTEQNRDEEISLVDENTAQFIKRWSPYYKKR